MRFRLAVDVELERTSGKFASRDELAEALIAELDVDPGSIYGVGADGESEYDVTGWEVSDIS